MNKPASQFVKIVQHGVFEVNRIEERSLQSKVLATVAAVALAMVLGALDYLTGREWAMSAFYLLPTCVAAWMAGRWAGFAVGALCTGAWFLSDIFGGAIYQSPLIPAWNAIMLFIFFLVVVWLLTAFQRSHYYLEQTVEQRTAALRTEMEERKRLEQANIQAERLGVVGSMAAQVAHEIRNPLGSISLNLDLIGEELHAFANSSGSSTAECDVLLHEMRSQVLRIRQVLQEYLRFARMPKSERAAVSLPAFLEKKLNFMQPLLDQKHVDLSRTLDPNLPPVQVDAEQLWEAILNLISNAVDAMPDGGSLTVSAQRHGAEALLSISDNGRGMTEEEVRLLFVPFFTTKSDGTGLGLAYTQRVVNEHGGKINCATARGKGSTFSIQLPLAVGA
ncbi:MAG TPA: ATP-binding protein [Candidatus Acidoferrum sp.]|nr:ATP-binding protein [Candidatus Acidoferrum sp.]